MEVFTRVITKKPVVFVAVTAVYALCVLVLKWWIRPDIHTALFVIGCAIGLYFLDIAELFFRLDPSPFHSVVFCGLFSLVSLFVVTSSGSAFAEGLVLSLYVQLIGRQLGEWYITGNISSWFRMTESSGSIYTQRVIFGIFVFVFMLETLFFIQ